MAANYGCSVAIWYDYWSGNQAKNKRNQTVIQMRAMLADPSTPKSPETNHLNYLLSLYSPVPGGADQRHIHGHGAAGSGGTGR